MGELPDDGWERREDMNRRYELLNFREVLFPAACTEGGRVPLPTVDYCPHDDRGKQRIPYLHIGCPLKPGTDINAVAEMIFAGLAETTIIPGQFELEAKYSWTPEAFQQENEIGSLSEIGFSASHKGYNQFVMHERRGPIDVGTTGDYSQLLPEIVAKLQALSAQICLCEEDAAAWMSKTASWWRWLIMQFKLKPAPEIRTKMPLEWLEECERVISKPLLSGWNDKSRIEAVIGCQEPSREASLEKLKFLANLALTKQKEENAHVSVTGKIWATDPTLTKRFQNLPQQAVVTKLEVKSKSLEKYNGLGIFTISGWDDITFWLRASPRDCPLLELQNKLCEELGVVFPEIKAE